MIPRRKSYLVTIFVLVAFVLAIRNFGWPFANLPNPNSKPDYSRLTRKHESEQLRSLSPWNLERQSSRGSYYTPIQCSVNEEVRRNVGLPPNDERIDCLAGRNEDVYVPFSYVRKYFDIYGEKKADVFVWSHSYSRIWARLKTETYDPGGVYIDFNNGNVESRARVKYVSARTGVPVSTQWDKNGYHYPTQIAQFALSHWSRHHDPKGSADPRVAVFDDGARTLNGAAWTGPAIKRTLEGHPGSGEKCVSFDDEPIRLVLRLRRRAPVLSFDLFARRAATVTVSVKIPDQDESVVVRYVPDPKVDITGAGNTVSIGYETEPATAAGTWKRFTRNLVNDIQKGLAKRAKLVRSSSQLFVDGVVFGGSGCVANVSLADSRHMRMFFDAADWLVGAQNTTTGAWNIGVTFNLNRSKYPNAGEIRPGWVSAMGQGQAISALTRAFRWSRDAKYIKAASKGLGLFSTPAGLGGCKAAFVQKYAWYEEYPTEPSSFVLNGFMYALVGLYDLWRTLDEFGDASGADGAEALFRDGMASLRAMVPLFDVGSGTSYDLRHFTMGGSPKLARWDYHTTHVNLLYVLSTVGVGDERRALLETAERWLGYAVGKKAEHN